MKNSLVAVRFTALALALLAGVWMAPARAAESDAESDLWSLAPIVRPELPAVKNIDWCQTPIDRFILARLEADGFEPAPAVAKERLIRRVYFDLWDCPPHRMMCVPLLPTARQTRMNG